MYIVYRYRGIITLFTRLIVPRQKHAFRECSSVWTNVGSFAQKVNMPGEFSRFFHINVFLRVAARKLCETRMNYHCRMISKCFFTCPREESILSSTYIAGSVSEFELWSMRGIGRVWNLRPASDDPKWCVTFSAAKSQRPTEPSIFRRVNAFPLLFHDFPQDQLKVVGSAWFVAGWQC